MPPSRGTGKPGFQGPRCPISPGRRQPQHLDPRARMTRSLPRRGPGARGPRGPSPLPLPRLLDRRNRIEPGRRIRRPSHVLSGLAPEAATRCRWRCARIGYGTTRPHPESQAGVTVLASPRGAESRALQLPQARIASSGNPRHPPALQVFTFPLIPFFIDLHPMSELEAEGGVLGFFEPPSSPAAPDPRPPVGRTRSGERGWIAAKRADGREPRRSPEKMLAPRPSGPRAPILLGMTTSMLPATAASSCRRECPRRRRCGVLPRIPSPRLCRCGGSHGSRRRRAEVSRNPEAQAQ